MSDVAIHVENLGKQYRIGGPQARYNTFRDTISNTFKAPYKRFVSVYKGQSAQNTNSTFWALRNVSFSVKKGEVVGIIGRNGAGKSTLLKILSRITEPTEGEITIHGRIGSLLEVGTGFHPELTGRENVYLNGAILGMKRTEIEHKFDEIVTFSGVEQFLETPVKYYSSGMYVRLAFAVAAHLDPDVLLVDEVLSVGDIAFQEKCLGKMQQVAGVGKTVLFVSHNMAAIAALCTKAFWLDMGGISLSGTTGTVLDAYLKTTQFQKGNLSLNERLDRTGEGILRATEIRIEDFNGEKLQFLKSGQGVRFVITYVSNHTSEQQINELVAHLTIINFRDQRLFACMSDVVDSQIINPPDSGKLVCIIEELPLVPGQYSLHLSIHANRQLVDKIISAASFQVVEGDFFGTGRLPPDNVGNVLVRNKWQVED